MVRLLRGRFLYQLTFAPFSLMTLMMLLLMNQHLLLIYGRRARWAFWITGQLNRLLDILLWLLYPGERTLFVPLFVVRVKVGLLEVVLYISEASRVAGRLVWSHCRVCFGRACKLVFEIIHKAAICSRFVASAGVVTGGCGAFETPKVTHCVHHYGSRGRAGCALLCRTGRYTTFRPALRCPNKLSFAVRGSIIVNHHVLLLVDRDCMLGTLLDGFEFLLVQATLVLHQAVDGNLV